MSPDYSGSIISDLSRAINDIPIDFQRLHDNNARLILEDKTPGFFVVSSEKTQLIPHIILFNCIHYEYPTYLRVFVGHD